MNETKSIPWGFRTTMSLSWCNPQLLRDEVHLRNFLVDLCDHIGMKRYGDPFIVRFGDDPKVTGFSIYQMIETSNIDGHFVEAQDAVLLNIFSCKEYDVQKAVEFCRNYFEAEYADYNYTVEYILRKR